MKKIFFLAFGMSVISYAQELKTIEQVSIASKFPLSYYQIRQNVTILTSKDLEKFRGRNLDEVLNQIVGIQITNTYSNNVEPKTLRIHGGKNSNVLILIDGIPLRDVTSASDNLADLRLNILEDIERIEVINGASSVLYGSNATTSVINIKFKRKSINPIETKISARVGSYDTFAQSLLVKGKLDQVGYYLSGNNEKSSGFSSAEGQGFDKDGYEKQNIKAGFSVMRKAWSFSVDGAWSHHLYDYDGGAFSDAKNKGNDKQWYVDSHANYFYKKGTLKINMRYLENDRNNEAYSKTEYKGKNFLIELLNQYRFNQYFDLVAGVQHENQNMGNYSYNAGIRSEISNLDVAKNNHTDVFLNAYLSYDLLHLDLGARWIRHQHFGHHLVENIAPYLLKEWSQDYLKFGYSFATAYISPTLYQLYGDAFVKPNPALSPETNQSHQIDFSYGKKDRSFMMNFSLYQRKEKNIIEYQLDRYQNFGTNKIQGFDFDFAYRVSPVVNFGTNFSFVEKNDEKSLLRQPKQKVNAHLDFNFWKGNAFGISYQYVAKRKDLYYDLVNFAPQYVILQDFSVFNVNFNQEITKNVKTYLYLGNVFNKKYTDVVGYTTKGRNFTFGVDFRF